MNFASTPIVSELGLIGGSEKMDDVESVTQTAELAFAMDMDFNLDVGEEVWKAT